MTTPTPSDIIRLKREKWAKSSRAFKWTVRVLIGGPLLLALLVLLLMRSPVVGWIVKGQVRALTGGELTADSIIIGVDGRLIARNLVFSVPSLDGPERDLIRAERAVADVAWIGLFTSGAPRIAAVRLHAPVFRLSQSADDTSLNLGQLTFPSSPPPAPGTPAAPAVPSAAQAPPQIDVFDGAVEFAEHSQRKGTFTPLQSIRVAGSIMPVDDAGGVYTVRLQEIGRSPTVSGEQRGMILDGRLDLAASDYRLRLLNLPLESFTPEGVPSAYRDIWRRLRIQGRVTQTVFTYTQQQGVRLDVSLSGVSLDLPLEGRSAEGVTSDNLSVTQVSGVITLAASGLDADLTGILEGQSEPSRVRFETKGLSVNSALRCEITARDLSVDKDPAFYAFVSPEVRRYFEMFSGPTARFDARMVIFRGEPADGAAAPIRVTDGRLVFRNGTAAYDGFPYPFHDMSGIAEFDDNRLLMRDVTGVGPTGGRLTCNARIEPLDKTAEVEVDLVVRDVPIDRHLLASMPESDRRVIEQVFSRPQADRLLAEGHVLSRGRRDELLDRRDHVWHRIAALLPDVFLEPEGLPELIRESRELDRLLATPAFELGGLTEIAVRVFSPRGENSPWSVNIDIRMPEVGILPEPFPYPILARDVHVTVADNRVEVLRGRFDGLAGGSADLTAVVERTPREQIEEGSRPIARSDIRVSASRVPVNELLIQAIPESDAADAASAWPPASDPGVFGPPPPPLSARAILRSLRIDGTIDCVAAITESDDPARTMRHDVTVDLDGISIGPRWQPGERTLRLESLRGELNVTPERILVESLSGELWDQSLADPTDRARAAELHIDLSASLPDPAALARQPRDPDAAAERARIRVRADQLRLDSPLEVLVAAFSSEAGTLVNNIRSELRPAGTIDVNLELNRALGATGRADQSESVRLRITRASDVSIRLLEGRLGFDLRSGSAEMNQDPEGVLITLEDADAQIRFNGQDAGVVRAGGRVGLTPGLGLREPADASGVISGIRFESALTRALVAAALGEQRAEQWASSGLTGQAEVRADVRLADGRPVIRAEVVPSSIGLGLTQDGDALEEATVSGRFTLHAASLPSERRPTVESGEAPAETDNPEWVLSGRIDGLRVRSSGLTGRVDGDWSYRRALGFALSADAEADASRFGPEHSRLLPRDVREAVDQLGLIIDGDWRMDPATFRIAAPPGAEPKVGFRSEVRFAGASLDPGIPIESLSGLLRIDIDSARADPGPIRLELADAEARAQGVDLRRIAAVVDTGIRDPAAHETAHDAGSPIPAARTEIRSITASTHGGRAFASGSIVSPPESTTTAATTDGSLPDPPPPGAFFRIDVTLAGVAFAPLLEQLSARPDARSDLLVDAERVVREVGPEAAPDASRGVVDAWVSLAGRAGDPSSRFGRGSVRIASGQVLRLPVVYQLMQVSNFLLPSDDRLDYLQAVCHIEGERITFPQVAILSDSLSVLGSGTVDFPNLAVDMTFNSRANNRLPVLSDLLEVMRNELVTTRITGTVSDPDVSSSPLVGTRRFLSNLFNPSEESDPAFSSDAIDAIRRERERVRALSDTQRERGRNRSSSPAMQRPSRAPESIGAVEP